MNTNELIKYHQWAVDTPELKDTHIMLGIPDMIKDELRHIYIVGNVVQDHSEEEQALKQALDYYTGE